MTYIVAADASTFLLSLPDQSIDLVCIDPPYFRIVKDSWDNAWSDEGAYVDWLVSILILAKQKTAPTGSLLMFGGIGSHGSHPFFKVIARAEETWTYRNLITWQKRRAYGKPQDYLFCREEIVWFSASSVRAEVNFTVPLTNVKRGYPGFDPAHPAKSEYKRVSNVWTDIPELQAPKRTAQKPIPLLDRIIQTHSLPGQLVVDCFAGFGTSGISAVSLGRRFLGCEAIAADAKEANDRVAASNVKP